nr:cysteine protease ATG4 isoform X3 [Arachis hypogaea]
MVLKSIYEKIIGATCSSKSSVETIDNSQVPASLKVGSGESKYPKASLWSGFFPAGFSVYETYNEPSPSEKKAVYFGNSGWAAAVRKVVNSVSMRRFQERVLGTGRTEISSSDGDIWLLGVCHNISQQESTANVDTSNEFAAFEQDFSSKILVTYRKGFDAIGDSKYTSDVNWGCMLRSSQMLVAQALLFHKLGRSWRKNIDKPLDKEYIEILQSFGDSEASAFSIHNLLQAGKDYGLAVGSWVGPYAMCRTWEVLARNQRETDNLVEQPLPMAIYVVSGDEDGERGGAPVVCIEDASKRCYDFSWGKLVWTPLLLLVPLVLGLDKINPRVTRHCTLIHMKFSSVIRHIPLDSIDPSLAIGFYCRDKDDFDDFCSRASKLAEESNGAPLFTVAQSRGFLPQAASNNALGGNTGFQDDDSVAMDVANKAGNNEDDWQLL